MSRRLTRSSISHSGLTRFLDVDEPDDDEEWVTGDVSLISADNVRFRVAGLTLAWSSPVFADLLSLPGNQAEKVIPLTDNAIESADVIRIYLDLVSLNFGRLGIFYKSYTRWAALLANLTFFLDKYQSERGLKLLRSFGSEAVTLQRFSRMGDIIFASRVNDLALCFRILSSGNKKSKPAQNRRPLGTMDGSWQFSLALQSYEAASSIPFPFQWAIARAAEVEDRETTPRIFAHRFVEIMMTIYEQGRRRQFVKLTPGAMDLSGHPAFPPLLQTPNLDGYTKPT
ncbi:hypothetical protein A1Q1_04903 [Trichosporon asahii var. asahii CBS 2479]|uniref:BTB domain-containing protein n=1 Tax=Trichosporon asahii var. asahii (strain ATCC 90039 / CBS 2479 / JCM 2466 / KCTC 7840 / NBRC 103889/ NCYC 2677 / UAMH 7654) TaxID=1186058 RepID=J6FAT0_TRIAS|nr:hypothetical protein A1Q1_04903 [Trichosporon asahii var. asahii CBS 2479]EJT52297.1 hypothetical protein A1Q1_04903 [Trichosporon asahii var. asahii CBS 2479]